ncbi:hypothetical protein DES53_102177 [Roseimicrobium gellanilyticum]|uniref:PH (Pleckstrin Homology) domain-containing protein n=2 Tax=Roseimicrobium gellanilyticum TaxID=748857 RepID=A0A366HQ48_9BACT|nr:hypothetical protein DES53_102177 [Roseimicrobium gellanilyticum]
MRDNNLPKDVAVLVEAELHSSERVVWTGQPIPGRFAWRGIGDVLFGIPWTAFTIFCMVKGDDSSKLFGLPFLLIGVWLLSGPYRMRLKAARTAYVVTDKRALILEGDWCRSTAIRSCEPQHLGDIRCVQKPDRSGDIIFGCTAISSDEIADYGFLGIHDVKHVETLVRQLSKVAINDGA